MDMNRRGFLKMLGVSAAAIIVPAQSRIWVPDQGAGEIALPLAKAAAASENGDLVGGWFLPNIGSAAGWFDMRAELLSDAYHHFPPDIPLMVLCDPARGDRFQRCIWRGYGSPPVGIGHRVGILQSWDNINALLEASTWH